MKDEQERRLDDAIEALPREIPPRHDLWPAIEARLREADDAAAVAGARRPTQRRGWLPGWRAAAAALVLVTGTSMVTFLATRGHYAPGDSLVGLGTGYQPVNASVLPIDYQMARGELMAVLESSLERLDPKSRRVVESNLAEIRSALAAIDQALGEDPDNASLQQLLVSTSQQELSLLQSIRRLAETTRQERDI